MMTRALSMPSPRQFEDALRACDGLAVIAEIKRRSPSRGAIQEQLDPAAVAREYAAGGAACLSVLTDHEFFGGSPSDLFEARQAVDLPVLRKDFTICPADVLEARIMGADAVLIIVAALTDSELGSLLELATEIDLAALVEIHDDVDLKRALHACSTTTTSVMIGVNQRDLASFEIQPEKARSLTAQIPAHMTKIAESGVQGPEDAIQLADLGFDAILVGEYLVTSANRSLAVAGLTAAGVRTPCS